MKKTISKILFGILAVVAVVPIMQVLAGESDINTNFMTYPMAGADGSVYGIDVQSNKKIIAVGSFINYNGVKVNRIMRLNSDLSLDTSFNMGVGFDTGSSTVPGKVYIQTDGKILVGGSFISYQGVQEKGLIRLNTDGSRDTSFNIPSTITSASVGHIVVQSDGKIIVGGTFIYQGSTKNLIRLNSDGSIDTSFTMSAISEMFQIALDSNGKITVAGGYSRTLVRYNSDGTVDSSFNIGSGFNGSVRSVLSQADGKLLVGGGFTTYQGVAASKIIRLNSDGSRDSTFDMGSGIANDTDAAVAVMVIDQNGKILVTGYFRTYKGVSANSLMRLNSDGSRDTSFNIGTAFGSNYGPYINNMKIGNNNQIILAGGFSKYQDILSPTGLIAINSDGSRDETLANITNGFDWTLRAIATQNDGKILVGGFFSRFNKTNTPGITRLNTDGSIDTSFNVGAGFDVGAYGYDYRWVSKILVDGSGKIFVFGAFSTYKGISAGHIIKLNTDGSRDTTFDIGAGFSSDYYSYPSNAYLQADGKLVVGGGFSTYKGVAVNKYIRLNTDGSVDTTFPNVGAKITSVQATSDGKFLGISGYNVIRLNSDLSIDTGWNVGAGFQYGASVFAIQPDGKVLVGGNIYSYQGVSIKGFVRLNTDGSIDTSFTAANIWDRNNGQQVEGIFVQPDGKILVWGSNKFVRMNSNGSIDTSFIADETQGGVAAKNFNGGIAGIVIRPNGNIIIGGGFTTYKGQAVGYVISLLGDTAVGIPNSSSPSILATAFTNKGFTQVGDVLYGSTPISLGGTNGNIPADLKLSNANVEIDFSANTQLKKSDATTNYSGWISTPVKTSFTTVNNTGVITSFKVGSSTESIKLSGGVATLSMPVTGKNIGDRIDIYYSENNGSTWSKHTTTRVIDQGGIPYVSFTTNHFTDFAITNGVPDTTAPIATITYSKSTLTNQNVTATVTFNENTTVTNNGGSTVYTFTDNGSFTFNFQDDAGNTSTATATVNWIDKVAPIGTVSYSTTGLTNQDVTATLSLNKTGTVSNNGGSKTYIFTSNGSFTFNFQDAAGNTATATATVTNIDKTPPVVLASYSTTSPTNQDVIVTISLDEPGTITNNNGSNTYTFTDNGSFTFNVQDTAGNVGSTTISVSWIDKTPPEGTIKYSTTKLTTQKVAAKLTLSDAGTIINNSGSNTYMFNENGSFTFNFQDDFGNIGSVTATVSWIDSVGANLNGSNVSPLNGGWMAWWIKNFGQKCLNCRAR